MIFYIITVVLSLLILWFLVPKLIEYKRVAVDNYSSKARPFASSERVPQPFQLWELVLFILMSILPIMNLIVITIGLGVLLKPLCTTSVEDLIKKLRDKSS